MAGPRSKHKHMLFNKPTFAFENLVAITDGRHLGYYSWTYNCTCLSTYQDILAYNCEDCESCELPFPIIEDSKRELAVALGMLDPDEKDKDGMPLTARCASVQINLLFLFLGTSYHIGEKCM